MQLLTKQVDITDHLIKEAILSMVYETFMPGSIKSHLKLNNGGWWWVTFDKKKPVAFAGMTRSRSTSDSGYLCLSGVLPSHRRLGLQRLLTRKRVAKARALGLRSLVTEVIQDNWPSMRNLIRCGFLPYAPLSPWGAKEATYWKLDLVV
jgi:ribosomal protein S18 acetylase RimI-like enzyme